MTGGVMFLISLIIVAVLTVVLALMYSGKKAKSTGNTTMSVLFSLNVISLTALLVIVIIGTILAYMFLTFA